MCTCGRVVGTRPSPFSGSRLSKLATLSTFMEKLHYVILNIHLFATLYGKKVQVSSYILSHEWTRPHKTKGKQ